MKETFTLLFKRPRPAVFAALSDTSKIKEMSGGKVQIAPVDGKPATGPGSAVLFKSGQPGVGDVLCETTQWVDNEKVVRKFHLTDMPTTVALEFKDDAKGCQVDILVELEPQSTLFKMMLPMLQKKVAEGKKEAIAKLQQQLDATA